MRPDDAVEVSRAMRRILISIACAAGMVVLSAGAVTAGEITGSGKDLRPLHANSECAFSGLDAHDAWEGMSQSWGQIPKVERDGFFIPNGITPWNLCNGHLNPLKA